MADPEGLPLLKLEGTDLDTVNHTAIGIIVAVCVSATVGEIIDFSLRRRANDNHWGRPRGWVIGTLVSSYTLLLPGLLYTLFSYKIAAVNGLYQIRANTENMIEFIKELWDSGAALGAACIVLFAVCIPVVKLVLLVSGGILRHSSNDRRVDFAGKAIHFVQKISKWASPDMFAYILFLNLVRDLNHPPTLNGIFRLDVGFSCFTVFCVASTISSLGVRSPPALEEGPIEISSRFGKKLVAMFVAVAVLTTIFIVTLYIGLGQPCMGLRLDMNRLFDSGELKPSLRPIIEMLHVQEKASADVSIWDCMGNLQGWMWSTSASGTFTYEVNAILGWIMIAVFVVAFTVFDMIALIVLAVLIRVQVKKKGDRPWLAMEAVRVFRKLSMLDVAVAGVCIIIFAGKIYRKLGVILLLERGIAYLFIAEFCHYAVYFLVTTMAHSMPSLEQHNSPDATPSKEIYSRSEDEEDVSSEVSSDGDEESSSGGSGRESPEGGRR